MVINFWPKKAGQEILVKLATLYAKYACKQKIIVLVARNKEVHIIF